MVAWDRPRSNEIDIGADTQSPRFIPYYRTECGDATTEPGHIVRIFRSTGNETRTELPLGTQALFEEDMYSMFDHAYLRTTSPLPQRVTSESVRIADLFCGCGGLSLGALEACQTLGKRLLPVLALDKDSIAVRVYERNFQPERALDKDVAEVLDGEIGSEPTKTEEELLRAIGRIEILLAGPPCQGYSSLNNFTRQNDHRNALYERVARFVEIARPVHVLVENIPTVIHSKEMVVQKTIRLMKALGYSVDDGIIDLSTIGVPQKRKRHVIVASKSRLVSVERVIDNNRVKKERSFAWAALELAGEATMNILDTPTKHSQENLRRIMFLHRHQVYDLPDELRPRCHRFKKHGYKSMYGRMRLDEPAQTITSGFMSPGQGRFIHPTKPRTITPHEAARLQLFPDYFDFSQATTRQSLASLIGNAAPMKLSYAFCLDLLC